MRLSEDRIESIAKQIVKELNDRKIIKMKSFSSRVENEILKVVMQDLAIEDEINAEAEKQIDSMKRDIPYGSEEWNAVFTQIKDKLCQQRNYIS